MNRFRFRLESVLRFRGAEEEKKKREFGTVMRKLKGEENKLNSMKDTLDEHEKNMEELGQGKVSARELQNSFNYARALDGKIDRQQGKLKEAEGKVDEKRVELVESTKRKRIFERLKESAREEYDHAVVKEEQAIIDELTSQYYNKPEK